MKTKDSLSIFAEAFFFWSLIVFMVVVYAFYVGEKMGRESVACPEPDTLYIQTSFDEYGEPYQELVTDLEINKYPEAIEK